MPHEPSLHLLAIDLLNSRIISLAFSSIRHPLDRTRDCRHKSQVPRGQHSTVDVESTDIGSLKRGMGVQPTTTNDTADGAGQSSTSEERCGRFDERSPETREGRSGYAGSCGEHAAEERVLKEGEADCGGRRAEREDEAKVAAFGLERGHGLIV